MARSKPPTKAALLKRLRADLPTMLSCAEGGLGDLPLETAFAVDLLRDEIARGAQAEEAPDLPLPLPKDDVFVQAAAEAVVALMRRYGIPPEAAGAERRLLLSLLVRLAPGFLPLAPRAGLLPPSPYLLESRKLHNGGLQVFDEVISKLTSAP
ncbi:MAG: hypothetical protein AB7I01_12825, partial [Gammaproteobacteria bacterium]